MKTYFVINSITNGGFWDSNECRFRGILFATKYENQNDRKFLNDLKLASKGSYCIIQQIYTD